MSTSVGQWVVIALLAVCAVMLLLNWTSVPATPASLTRTQTSSSPAGLPATLQAGARFSEAVPEDPSPLVSIITMSRGQWWCARNVLLNACYQNYPQHKIELLIGESSFSPSPFINADIKALKCNITLRTWWFNISVPHMKLGGMRNFLSHKAQGEYVLMMDNDDIYHPRYVERVVETFRRNRDIAILEAKPHFAASQNADGTIVNFPGMSPGVGGHMTSLTKELTVLCEYTDNYVNEEFGITSCAEKHNLLSAKLDMKDPASNAMLLMKIQSGLSITDQVWFVNRHQYARMQPSDWLNKLSHLVWYYEQVHEMTRPPHVPFVPRIGMPYPGEDPEKDESAGILRQPYRLTPSYWENFHRGHPNFFSDETVSSYCKNFALLPGVQLTRPTGIHGTLSDAECCEHCRNLTTTKDVCVAMSFNSVTNQCVTQVVKKPLPKGFFPERIWTPETVLTVRTAALIVLDPKIGG